MDGNGWLGGGKKRCRLQFWEMAEQGTGFIHAWPEKFNQMICFKTCSILSNQ